MNKKEREREREKQDVVRYSDMHANCLSFETRYRIYFIQTFPLKIDYIEPSSHFQYLHTTIQTYFFISSCKLENKISSILKKKKKKIFHKIPILIKSYNNFQQRSYS